jgi:hypothetical protein
MSEPRDKDSAAKRRADELTEKLGIDLWAKYPRELMEFRMDRPPRPPKDNKDMAAWQKYDADRAQWKPALGPKTRVYATYMRYSWCWPICLEYAVVTDDRDEILRDSKGRPLVLSEEAVADMLGLSKQRVSAVVLDLIADKLLRVEHVAGTARSAAVYLEPKPTLTKEERRVKSTLVTTGLEGPRLEPAVQRRFSSLLNQLGADDAVISLPAAEWEALNPGSPNGTPHQVRVGDYRTLVWKQILDNRTLFLNALKSARYSERKAYADMSTRVRILIPERESPEQGVSAGASSSGLSTGMHAGSKTSPGRDAQVPTRGETGAHRPGIGDYGIRAEEIEAALYALAPIRKIFPGEDIPDQALRDVARYLSTQLREKYEPSGYINFVADRRSRGKIGAGLALDKKGLPADYIRQVRANAAEAKARDRDQAAAEQRERGRRVEQLLTFLERERDPNLDPDDQMLVQQVIAEAAPDELAEARAQLEAKR